MRRGRREALAATVLLVAVATAGACSGHSPSSLDPQGPESNNIADLWWTMLAIAGAIFLLVIGLLAYALLHRREPGRPRFPGPASGHAFIVAGGVVLPVVVLSVLMALTIRSIHSLTRSHATDLAITVTAHDWWWEVDYPASGVVTANEIHIPVGKRVEITGNASDVIHSFWAPQLIAKFDLIPGNTHTFLVQADKPGVYRGQCAEYCGLQHANMAFIIVAEPEQEFMAWLAQQRQPLAASADPAMQRGLQVFLGSNCASCHAISGTAATAKAGPDLTHVASRSFIAAGALKTNPENLERWVSDPQGVKPGANMPAVPLDPGDLQALVAFLAGLK